MYLIVGLGNPDKQYEQTRHNFGFMVLDLLASGTKWEHKYNSQFLKLEDVILAKPQTFMNKSGEAIKEILSAIGGSASGGKYSLQLVIVHDDLDFPLGSMKIQKNASAAGHNGVQNIIDELGTQNFIRVRLGIDSPARGQIPGEDFVLQKFSPDEQSIVVEVLEQAKAAVETLQTEGLKIAQSRFNG